MSWRRRGSALLRFVALALASSAVVAAAGSRPFDGEPLHATGREPGATSPPDARPRFHDGSAASCRTCHAPDATGGAGPPEPTRICLRCHDGVEGIPDVVGEDVNRLDQRSAGHFAGVDVASPNGHDLGSGLARSTGSGLCGRCHSQPLSEARVTCVDCHDPHGNGNARLLRWASAPRSTPPIGLFTDPSAVGMGRYEERHVAYGTLDSPALREPTSVCLDCHHVFSGPAHTRGRGGHPVRHPSYDSENGAPNQLRWGAERGAIALAHWERGRGAGFQGMARLRTVVPGATSFAAASRAGDTNGVHCLTCHRAHGSSHGFGLAWNPEGGAPRSGCEQCHAVSAESGAPSADGVLGLTR